MQVVLADAAGDFQRQAVFPAQCIHADQLHNLVQFRFLLQDTHGFGTQLVPFRRNIVAEPFLQAADVE